MARTRKRNAGRGCLGVLVGSGLLSVVCVSAAAILFQQSQASVPTATPVVLRSATPRPAVPTLQMAGSPAPFAVPPPADGGDGVTVEIITDPAPSPTDSDFATNPTVIPTIPLYPPDNTHIPTMQSTPSDVPRHSGTSTYPLTVTAEVQFAQTNVARYQDRVAATRTAIAAESDVIFATLTAAAPGDGTVTP